MTYDTVTVRRYDDSNMAGTAQRNKQRGTWFVHGINDTADLIDIVDDKDTAERVADQAASEGNDTTDVIIRNPGDQPNEHHATTTFTAGAEP